MDLLEDLFKGNLLTGVVVGLGAVLLAPAAGHKSDRVGPFLKKSLAAGMAIFALPGRRRRVPSPDKRAAMSPFGAAIRWRSWPNWRNPAAEVGPPVFSQNYAYFISQKGAIGPVGEATP